MKVPWIFYARSTMHKDSSLKQLSPEKRRVSLGLCISLRPAQDPGGELAEGEDAVAVDVKPRLCKGRAGQHAYDNGGL